MSRSFDSLNNSSRNYFRNILLRVQFDEWTFEKHSDRAKIQNVRSLNEKEQKPQYNWNVEKLKYFFKQFFTPYFVI